MICRFARIRTCEASAKLGQVAGGHFEPVRTGASARAARPLPARGWALFGVKLSFFRIEFEGNYPVQEQSHEQVTKRFDIALDLMAVTWTLSIMPARNVPIAFDRPAASIRSAAPRTTATRQPSAPLVFVRVPAGRGSGTSGLEPDREARRTDPWPRDLKSAEACGHRSRSWQDQPRPCGLRWHCRATYAVPRVHNTTNHWPEPG